MIQESLSDLELASNDELVCELLRRTTFAGIIISNSEPFRNWEKEVEFHCRFNENMEPDLAAKLLKNMAGKITKGYR